MPNSVQNSVFEVCDTDLKTPAGIYTNQDGYTLRTPSITVGPLIHHPPLPFLRLRIVSLTSQWISIGPLPSSRSLPLRRLHQRAVHALTQTGATRTGSIG